MKKVFIVFFILFLISPIFAFAQRIGCPPADSLVPCWGTTCPCTLCDFFVMISRVINFALIRIVPAIVALMIVIAGAMMVSAYAGQSGSETIAKIKKLLGALFIGLLIIYSAWVLFNLFLSSIDIAEWTGLRTWWVISCEISVPVAVEGCTDLDALNYNPSATIDDGSCIYEIPGCMDLAAINYNLDATIDDGSCIYEIPGCTDTDALNYNSSATIDDGSCIYSQPEIPVDIAGCMDLAAINYNPNATIDNGSCLYCGNSIINLNRGEVCDCGMDLVCTLEELNGHTCQDFVYETEFCYRDNTPRERFYTGGELGCLVGCSEFDFSSCIHPVKTSSVPISPDVMRRNGTGATFKGVLNIPSEVQPSDIDLTQGVAVIVCGGKEDGSDVVIKAISVILSGNQLIVTIDRQAFMSLVYGYGGFSLEFRVNLQDGDQREYIYGYGIIHITLFAGD